MTRPFYENDDFKLLKEKWDRKLKKSGFLDIESSTEKERYDNTNRSIPPSRGTVSRRIFVGINFVNSTELYNAMSHRPAQAVFWELASDAARALSPRTRYRAFFLDVCDVGRVSSAIARRHGIRRADRACQIFRAFIIKAGIVRK